MLSGYNIRQGASSLVVVKAVVLVLAGLLPAPAGCDTTGEMGIRAALTAAAASDMRDPAVVLSPAR